MGVASSVVEHSAFNRLVLSSNLRRPIYLKQNRVLSERTRFFDVFGTLMSLTSGGGGVCQGLHSGSGMGSGDSIEADSRC
jgi:hypothetical protein